MNPVKVDLLHRQTVQTLVQVMCDFFGGQAWDERGRQVGMSPLGGQDYALPIPTPLQPLAERLFAEVSFTAQPIGVDVCSIQKVATCGAVRIEQFEGIVRRHNAAKCRRSKADICDPQISVRDKFVLQGARSLALKL